MNQADMMSHHAALETAPRGLMLNQDHLRDPLAGEQQSELRQYRVLLFFTVACFLVYAMLSRPLRRGGGSVRPEGAESMYAEARRLACTALQYAFMR